MKLSFLLILTTFCCITVFSKPVPKINQQPAKTAKEDIKFPVPPDNANRLFYVQRDPNTNTIMYDLNFLDGRLDEENPVRVYWLRYADKGQKEDLSYIQRKLAYGVVTKKIGNEKFDVRLVSYKKFPLLLMKANDGKYHIFATIAQKQMMLERVYAKIEGGSFLLPNVVYVELRGTDQSTGREIVERFKP